MNKTEQSRVVYNKKAQAYDNSPEGHFTAPFKQELVKAVSIKPNDNVLDVACGNGNLLGMLGSKTKINGYGIDISDNMITEAKRLYPDFQYTVSNSDKLPFNDDFFDVITVSAAFHHFEQPILFLNEAKRVLKKGGQLFIAEVNWSLIVRFISNLLFTLLNTGDVKVYSPKELDSMLSNSGFKTTLVLINGNIQLIKGQK